MSRLPFITSDLPAVPGRLPRQALTRICTEQLSRQLCGEGAYRWLRIRKSGIGHAQVVAAICRALDLKTEDIGFAGARDRQSICEQWFSFPIEPADNPGAAANIGYRKQLLVLEQVDHVRPVTAQAVKALSWGFRIEGGAVDDGYRRAMAILDRCRQVGVPNYMRVHGRAKWGRLLLQGKRLPARLRVRPEDRRGHMRAAQALAFNRLLATRIEAGLLDHSCAGDLLLCSDDSVDLVADCEHADRRLASWEASVTGLVPGRDMRRAEAEAAAMESSILAESGIEDQAWERLPGERRVLRYQPAQVRCDIRGADLEISCVLGTMHYVTTLIEELLKPEGHLP